MLAKKERIKNEVFEICKNSPDINVGDSFKGVISADSNNAYADTPCHCIGKEEDEECLFFTDDMRICFSVYGGWGEKDGFLVAMSIGKRLNFGQQMDIHKLELYVENMPKPHGAYSSMSRKFEAEYITQVIRFLQEPEARRPCLNDGG